MGEQNSFSYNGLKGYKLARFDSKEKNISPGTASKRKIIGLLILLPIMFISGFYLSRYLSANGDLIRPPENQPQYIEENITLIYDVEIFRDASDIGFRIFNLNSSSDLTECQYSINANTFLPFPIPEGNEQYVIIPNEQYVYFNLGENNINSLLIRIKNSQNITISKEIIFTI